MCKLPRYRGRLQASVPRILLLLSRVSSIFSLRSSRRFSRDHRVVLILQLNVRTDRRCCSCLIRVCWRAEIVYRTARRQGDASQRVVHPYHIFPHVRSWQLIAYCENREDVIMFKADRIQKATLLDEAYEIEGGFDLDEYMGDAWGVIRAVDIEPEEVVLHFAQDAGRWVAEEYWHKSQQVEKRADGGVIFRLKIAVTPDFVNWILYYGSKVEVISPDHLRSVGGPI